MVGLGLAVGSEGEREVLGLAVTASQGKANIRSAGPALSQSRMQRLLICSLFGVIPHRHYCGLRRGHGPVRRSVHGKVAIRGRNRTHHGLAVVEAYMQ